MNTIKNIEQNVDIAAVTICFIVTLSAYAIYSYKKTYTFWSRRGVKGPTPLPFFGNALTYILNPLPDMDMMNRKIYGRMYGVYDGTTPVLFISDPEIIEKVFITNHNSFKYHMNSVSNDPMVIHSIFLKRGEELKRIRAVFTSGVTQSKLKGYLNMIKVGDMMEKIKSVEGKDVNIYNLVSIFMLNNIIQIFYGLDLDLFKNSDHEIIQHARNLFDFFDVLPSFLRARLPFLFNFYPDKSGPANDYLRILVKIAFNERIKILKEKKENETIRNDFLQQFLDSNLTDIEKEANAVAALGAGFDTTSFTLSYMFYELGRNQRCQRRLQDEIDGLLEKKNRGNSDGIQNLLNIEKKITFEDIQSLPYLEQCFYETLRLHPGDIRSVRQSSEETLIPMTNIKVPPATVINVPVIALHQDEELFSNAKDFDPDRWNKERKERIKNCSFMSFGAGPRKCPGGKLALMNAKIALINILRIYDVEVSRKSDISVPAGWFMTQPRKVWVKFISRDRNG